MNNEDEKSEFDVPNEDCVNFVEKSAERFSVLSAERQRYIETRSNNNLRNPVLPFSNAGQVGDGLSEKTGGSHINQIHHSPTV